MSGRPLITRTGIVTPPAAQCDRILIGSSAKPGTGTPQPSRGRKSRPLQDKEHLAESPNNKTDTPKEPQNISPTDRTIQNTGMWRSKCKARSPFDRRPCFPQFFDRANPTLSTQRFVTCRCEFVHGQPVPGLWAKDSGRDPDGQKFASAALNNS